MRVPVSETVGKTLLALCSVALTVATLFAVDALVGVHLGRRYPHGLDLVLPSFSHKTHRTAEFAYEVRVNSLGFRDREFGPKEEGTFRIVCLGDSFTYGWGVGIDDAWPKRLEQELVARGRRVEVANLGGAALAPRGYADVGARAIPVLEPDLVLVAVLQGDDLQQSFRRGGGPGEPRARSASDGTSPPFPHLRRALDLVRSKYAGEDLTPDLEADRKRILASLTPGQRARFRGLDDAVRDAYLRGSLNPDLIRLGLVRSDYLLGTLALDLPATRKRIENMAWELGRIKDVSERHDARVLVVSVPYGSYVSRRSFETRRRLGFSVREEMLVSSAPDDAIRTAADSAGVAFAEVTSTFREVSQERALYYELDGHFNAEGHAVMARALLPIVEGTMP